MRKIRLSEHDFTMFDIDISPVEHEFFQKHKDAFKRMWTDQGTKFWTRFVMAFRSFSVNFGVIKQYPGKSANYDEFIDEAFTYLKKEFVEGKFNQSRNLVLDIVLVAQNRHTLVYLESKSYAKDPFYNKETRDVFRRLFGPPGEKSSYIKVYFLLPLFVKFGGSVCQCLRRWLEAEDQDESDEAYWTPTVSATKTDNSDKAKNSDPQFDLFRKERLSGSPDCPVHVPGWSKGDPRFNDPENPLYNPSANPRSDWRDDLDYPKFLRFLDYCTDGHLMPKGACHHHSCDHHSGLVLPPQSLVGNDCDHYIAASSLGSHTCCHHGTSASAKKKKKNKNKKNTEKKSMGNSSKKHQCEHGVPYATHHKDEHFSSTGMMNDFKVRVDFNVETDERDPKGFKDVDGVQTKKIATAEISMGASDPVVKMDPEYISKIFPDAPRVSGEKRKLPKTDFLDISDQFTPEKLSQATKPSKHATSTPPTKQATTTPPTKSLTNSLADPFLADDKGVSKSEQKYGLVKKNIPAEKNKESLKSDEAIKTSGFKETIKNTPKKSEDYPKKEKREIQLTDPTREALTAKLFQMMDGKESGTFQISKDFVLSDIDPEDLKKEKSTDCDSA